MGSNRAARCADCAAELDHCHGTLITHLDGLAECTEPGCADLHQVRHTLLLTCVEFTDCGCVEVSAEAEAAPPVRFAFGEAPGARGIYPGGNPRTPSTQRDSPLGSGAVALSG